MEEKKNMENKREKDSEVERFFGNPRELGPLILGLNARGEVIFFNNTCEEVTDQSEKEVLNQPIWEFFPEEYRNEDTQKFFLSPKRDELPNSKLIPWLSDDDEEIPIKWKTIQLKSTSGRIEFAIVIGIDLEEYEEAYKKLDQSKPIFESLLENIDSGIFVLQRKPEGLIIKSNNSKLEKLLGFKEGGLENKKLDILFHTKDLKTIREKVEELPKKEKKEEVLEVRGEKKNGEEIWLECRLTSLQLGEKKNVLGITKKIEKPQEMMDHAGVGIMIVQDTEIVYFNQRAAELFECSEEEFGEIDPFDFVHPEDKEELQLIRRNQIEDKTPFTKEHRIITKEGEVRYLSVQSVQVTRNGNPAAQLIVEDITEYKEMEKKLRNRRRELSRAYTRLRETEGELREKTKQLEKTSETRGEFIDLVSHELSSLLTPAKTYVDMLEEERLGEIKRSQKEKLSEIQSKFDQIENLVEDMLDLSRIEADRIRKGEESVSISDMIETVLDELDSEIKAKKHELKLDIDGGLPNIVGDPRLLEKVFRNLISNAIQYTPPGGKIEIETKKSGGKIHTKISDNGIGIPEEEQEKIFEKFYRRETEKAGKARGLGIGLAITKNFVELHGGDIWVESEVGEGSTFHTVLEQKEA